MPEYNIPFFNYRDMIGTDPQGMLATVEEVIRRGAFILQKDLDEFEKNAREFLNVKHFIGVNDGTNAIYLCLWAAGLKAGDEVILPSHTYIATAGAVNQIGAVPVLVECGKDHLIDINDIERAITPKTRAIMPVHLNGRICDMDPILEIARKHKLHVIEDGAQCFGARYKGKSAGTQGLGATISFYPAKVLGCFGDAGGVITNDDEFAKKIKLLRDHGRSEEGEFVCWGTNARLDNLAAAVLDFKLKSFPAAINRRREIASLYDRGLRGLKQLLLPPAPEEDDIHFDIYQNYEIEAENRDGLKKHLEEKGIRTLVQWGGKAVHQIEALGFKTKLPRTDRLFERCLMIPMNTSLKNDEINYIIQQIQAFYAV